MVRRSWHLSKGVEIMDAQRRERGGIGVTQRGDRYEATYNVPKAELPEGSKRVRITAHGSRRTRSPEKTPRETQRTKSRTPSTNHSDSRHHHPGRMARRMARRLRSIQRFKKAPSRLTSDTLRTTSSHTSDTSTSKRCPPEK